MLGDRQYLMTDDGPINELQANDIQESLRLVRVEVGCAIVTRKENAALALYAVVLQHTR